MATYSYVSSESVSVGTPVYDQSPLRSWPAEWTNCFPGRDGCRTCLYVTACPCLAAGDVASAAGRSYCCSCFLCPFLLPICVPGHFAQDREALVKRFSVDDRGMGCLGACFLNWLGCGLCLLCQEVALLKEVGHYERAAGAQPPPPQQQQILIHQQVMTYS